MFFNIHVKFILVVIILPFILLGSVGCSTVNTVSNWQELQEDHPILVITKAGEEYRLDKWRFYHDSSIVSLQTDIPMVFLKDSIASVSTINSNTTIILKTTATVIGITSGVAFIIFMSWLILISRPLHF